MNYTLGAAWDITDSLTVTLDFFQIELEDRISQTGTIDITGTLAPTGVGCDGLLIPACLENLGVAGASDLSSVSFFTNDFETTTKGIDLVATYVQDWGDFGVTNFSAAWNYTKTRVDDAGSEVSRDRLLELERYNPRNRGVFTINHMIGDFRVLFRANYYDDWTEGSYSGDPTYVDDGTVYSVDCDFDNCYKGEWIFDLEGAYTFADRYTVSVGAYNVFDQDAPDDADNSAGPNFSNNSGQQFTETSHWGINGGFWYVRFKADFN